jgi:thiosulfate dehydrogenase
MSIRNIDGPTWVVGLVFLGLAVAVGHSLPHAAQNGPEQASSKADLKEPKSTGSPTKPLVQFTPPPDDALPEGKFGEMVKLGEAIFDDTRANAGAFVGNNLRCANCHLDRGRLANSAPLWAAYLLYPAYRSKNDHVNSFAERLQGCFRFSMNGKAPPLGDKVLVALESYAYALAKGAPTGVKLPGQGYPKMEKPAKLDYAHGKEIYAARCALCHGADGQGQKAGDGEIVFPPLWGARSYNWGAGMSSIANAASFVKANMPLSQGGTLSDEEAWDVATYIDSQERPQDPRFTGSVAETRKAHHDSDLDMYGQIVNGLRLGEQSPPFQTIGD